MRNQGESDSREKTAVPISVVILAKNEESNIQRCIDALDWASEVVVVDDASTDRTVELAEGRGARVVDHRFESFAKQRNWTLSHAGLTQDWVLMLDADEVATDAFADAIRAALQQADRDGTIAFRTCRKTILDGVWLKYSDGFPVWIMRLVRRGHAWFEDSGHGEVPVPDVDGKLGTIDEPFLHYAFSRGMDDWWIRHVRYAGREAQREQQRDSESIVQIFSFDSSKRRRGLRTLARKTPGRGFLRFLYQFILRRGFLDGPTGLRYCRMMGCYESMIDIRRHEPGLATPDAKSGTEEKT